MKGVAAVGNMPMEYSGWFVKENERYLVRYRQVGIRSMAGLQWVHREVQVTDKVNGLYDTFTSDMSETFTIEDGIAGIEGDES